MSRPPEEILTDALAHLDTLQTYAKRDLDDQVVIDAVCMRLSAAIETLAALPPALREQLFGTNWPLMWGMRNRIAHGYMLVDTDIVRKTVQQDIPTIIKRIRSGLHTARKCETEEP
ncbi:MAG: DUF86 domain-containing protein [Propionibacteriaceae bacterium]|nr:DUF86 domain-containing protein [Propionibacteriaceae bacterium]